MKTLTLTLALLLLTATGCVRLEVSQTYYDEFADCVITNRASGFFFCSKSSIEKIEIAKRTKTTSALVGARSADTGSDTEALGALLGAAIKASK
jgi:hypothetical protein